MSKLQAIEILADSSRGQYIPQYWAESKSDDWTGFDADDIAILLAGPTHEYVTDAYWDVWAHVLENATCTLTQDARNGAKQYEYRLHQGESGDLFCVCEELMTATEFAEFFDAYDEVTLTYRHGNESKYPPKVYDDCSGDLYVYGQEYGPICLIRANSWEAAYEIAIDESPPVALDDVHEAYGFDTQAELDDARRANPDGGPELAEGYQYQTNATGTGIVNSGYYEWLNTLDEFNRGGDQITPVWTRD